MLAFLQARAIPGVESVEDGTYRRSICLNGSQGHFAVSLDEANHALAVRVQFGDPRSLFFIIERIRAMFDLNADWAAIVRDAAHRSDVEPGRLTRLRDCECRAAGTVSNWPYAPFSASRLR